MNFRYIGDDNDPPQRTLFMGVAFELGCESEVTNPVAIKKLSASKCFECVGPVPSNKVLHVEPRDGLIEKLERANVRVDRRWGMTRLKMEVQALGIHAT